MVTELKFDDADVNFKGELQALIQEDLKGQGKKVDEGLKGQGEWAQRLQTPGGGVVQKQEMGLDDSAEIDFRKSLAEGMGMEFVRLSEFPPTDYKVLQMVPLELAKAYMVYPLNYDGETKTMTLAISDPSNPTIVDDLTPSLGCEIHQVMATEDDIIDHINSQYGVAGDSIDSLLDEYADDAQENVLGEAATDVVDVSDRSEVDRAPPIIKLTVLILVKAIQDRGSDIHIEPFENLLRVRYRVDGVLREMQSPPKDMQAGLLSRLKVMANLDIAETRRPQSGRIRLLMAEGRLVDLRVETVPTVHGEAITMRVLDKSMMQIGITQLGMRQDLLELFMREVRKPDGVVLVTGPTGCGKTTTLYAAINEIKSVEDKLITTEEPVEYQVDGLIQVNIHEAVGLTFARCLRSILRQDPDKILVGEIRDLETAQMSMQSALTGHLVFSTLHTNSAAGTVTRLVDMGIEPFLLTSTLRGIVGQRLIRVICANCAEPYTPTPEDLLDFRLAPGDVAGMEFFQGAGCEECSFTGYKGRLGIFELLVITEEICDLILEHATSDEIHALAVKQGMVSLRQDGWDKIRAGLTTFAEVTAHAPREEGSVHVHGTQEQLGESPEQPGLPEAEAGPALPE